MQGGGPEAGDKIEYQESLRAQSPLQHSSEYEECVHVEEHVPEAAVHEHVGQNLPGPEKRRGRIEHREVPHHEILIDESGDEQKQVYDYDMPGGRRKHLEEAAAAVSVIVVIVISHYLFFNCPQAAGNVFKSSFQCRLR